MAIKGEMIDVTKLQDYELKNGCEILFLEKDSVSSVVHPILVLFKDDAGGISFNRCTEDGFSGSDKSPSEFDLVLKEEFQAEVKPIKKRKVVQLAVLNEVPSGYPELFALTDDGHIYSRKIIESEYEPWEKLSGVPQD